MFPAHIFKAYDIRGIYPQELNEELAYKIGRAFGTLRHRELGRDKIKVVVGRDMRPSSLSLQESLMNGLKDQGLDVIDIGLVSTPTFYFGVSFYEADGGLMISASHNPTEYNGIKITRERATPLGQGTGMEELKDLVAGGNFVNPAFYGTSELKAGILDEQMKLEKNQGDLNKIKPFKIVVDPANAAGILYLEKIFSLLPQVEWIKMNFELDGTFPAHQADPFQEKNVKDLQDRVVAEKADLGIATDGDGDRIFFIDDSGRTVAPPIMRGILAQIFLRENSGATICYDIRPGKITRDMIEQAGGVPCVTKVGHSLIKKQMLETGAFFGGESSGHFFVKFPYGVFEAPIVVILKFLLFLSEKNVPLSAVVGPLKKYFSSGEINLKVENKDKVIKCLKEKFADGEINLMDGLSVSYPDFWFNVRGSNTEPLLRVSLEGVSQEIVETKVKEIQEVIKASV